MASNASNQNFFRTLHECGFQNPDSPFLTPPGGPTWSYGAIDALSARLAGVFAEAGLKPGDRICVQVEKSAENVALYLAALRFGLVYTPLNTAYTREEIGYFLSDCDPAAFVCDPARVEEVSATAVFTLGADGGGSLMTAARKAKPAPAIAVRHEDDLAVILYTSGTTGRSKGAMLSHRNLATNAATLHEIWGFAPGDVLLHALPIFHIHGLFVALHTAMLNGSEVLFLPRFSVAAVKAALARATIMMGVPTFYTRLLADEAFAAADCASMRLFISGSAPLTTETHRAFEARTGHAILERYGMSEAGMIASNPLHGARVAGTVGFALPGVDIRITDETGAPSPPGVVGSVDVRGPNIFQGYWRRPEKTATEFRDGWFGTGDLGALDDEGRLTLSGRSKDLIIAGGYNIYPKEIEDVIGAVTGVGECAVIGAPHPDMGEGVVAVLAANTGGGVLPKEEIEEKVGGALSALASFKRPRKLIWIDALPRNAMGKVQKAVLREAYKDAFATS